MASCHSTVCLTRQRQKLSSIHVPSTCHVWSPGEAPASCCGKYAVATTQVDGQRAPRRCITVQWKASRVRPPAFTPPCRPTSGQHPTRPRSVPLSCGSSGTLKHKRKTVVSQGTKITRLVYTVLYTELHNGTRHNYFGHFFSALSTRRRRPAVRERAAARPPTAAPPIGLGAGGVRTK